MTTLLNGLVAYYKLDETSGATLSDVTGTYPITHSGTTLNQTGKIGKAITINATINNFNIGYLGTNSSINFWHKYNSGTPSLGSIFEIPVTSNRYHQLLIDFNTSTNKYYFNSFSQCIGTSYSYTITDAINPSNYNMVTVTWDSSSFYVYVNGVYNGTFTKGSAGSCNATNWRMGRYTNQNYDEIGIWNRTLTSDEVSLLYNRGFGLTYPFENSKPQYSIFDDAVAYYDFSKNALDVIGENNGTVSGATLTTNHLNQSNSAYSFDGTDDWIDCGNFDPSTNRQYLSVFSWIKTNFNQSRTVIGRWSASGDPSGNLAAPRLWVIIVEDTGVVSIVISNNGKHNGAVQKNYKSIDSFNDNTWHFVGFTWSNGTFKLFVDGIELTGSDLNKVQDDSFTQHYDASTKVRIGAYGNHVDAPAAFFNGSINLPMCFNKAFSADEVKQLYNLTKSKVIHPIIRGGRE